jgi:3-deoxy-D-manno-octulosonic acid (KDO) 8-phosphate synthase
VGVFFLVTFLQHKKLKNIEKIQKEKLVKTYKKYVTKKHSTKENSQMLTKLNKQMALLDKSYKLKYITKASYDKGRNRINLMIKRLKKE